MFLPRDKSEEEEEHQRRTAMNLFRIIKLSFLRSGLVQRFYFYLPIFSFITNSAGIKQLVEQKESRASLDYIVRVG
ncbi:hypothetical protein Bca4012_017086 [Brassica carinata]